MRTVELTLTTKRDGEVRLAATANAGGELVALVDATTGEPAWEYARELQLAGLIEFSRTGTGLDFGQPVYKVPRKRKEFAFA